MLGGNKCRIKAEYGIQKQRESQCKIRWTEQALLRKCSLERDLKEGISLVDIWGVFQAEGAAGSKA